MLLCVILQEKCGVLTKWWTLFWLCWEFWWFHFLETCFNICLRWWITVKNVFGWLLMSLKFSKNSQWGLGNVSRLETDAKSVTIKKKKLRMLRIWDLVFWGFRKADWLCGVIHCSEALLKTIRLPCDKKYKKQIQARSGNAPHLRTEGKWKRVRRSNRSRNLKRN